jgi:uncharacterized protein
MSGWQHWTAIAVTTLAGVLGTALTMLTLPGTWLMLLVAVGLQLWLPGLYSWWTLGVAGSVALLGEVVEFGASAMGAAKGGASKRGALGAMIGAVVGAIVGSPFFFPLGTLAGGALGAAVGTLTAERAWAKRDWTAASKAAGGAAAGRLVATVLKTAIAGGIAVLLIVASFLG